MAAIVPARKPDRDDHRGPRKGVERTGGLCALSDSQTVGLRSHSIFQTTRFAENDGLPLRAQKQQLYQTLVRRATRLVPQGLISFQLATKLTNCDGQKLLCHSSISFVEHANESLLPQFSLFFVIFNKSLLSFLSVFVTFNKSLCQRRQQMQ